MEETVKILLCEDDENLGMLLREYLQTKGFATTLCPDGEAGFKEFTKNKYDIAVLDVMMPKKDGFTLKFFADHDRLFYFPFSSIRVIYSLKRSIFFSDEFRCVCIDFK